MYPSFVLAGLTLLAGVNAVLSITNPNSQTTWYTNNTVSLNWTSATTDTYSFRALLSNTALLSSPQAIADETTATEDFLSILLPQVSLGSGYIVTFVNTTNTSQIFATSESFTIAAGTVSTSTSSSAASSTTAPAASVIPNFTSTSSIVFSTSASASASKSASSSSTLDPFAHGTLIGIAALFTVLGGTLVV